MNAQSADRGEFNSIRIRFTVIMLLLGFVPAATVSLMDHHLLFDHIRSERIETVGRVAAAKHAQLVLQLTRANDRAKTLLTALSANCNSAQFNRQCITRQLAAYLHMENALGATVRWKDEKISVGVPISTDAENSQFHPGQLAGFSGAGSRNNTSYFISATLPQDGMQLEIGYPSASLQPVFNRPKELGESGETFLTDDKGFFVTAPRYSSTQGHSLPIYARPLQSCLGGHSAEMLDLDYRDKKVIHGYRFVSELGSACIMAHADQAEAFAPLEALQQKLIAAALLFSLLVFPMAIYMARRMTTPIIQLAEAKSVLEESEKKYRQLFEDSSDGIFLLDANSGKFVDCNEKAARLHGLAKNELIGSSLEHISPSWQANGQLSAELSKCKFAAALDGEAQQFEFQNKRADGSLIDVEICLNKISIRDSTYLHIIVRDITARKQIEELLSSYRQVIETSIDGFWIVNCEGHLLFANQAYADMSGYSIEELSKMHISQLDELERREDVAAHIEKIISRGHERFETRHRRKDGRVFDVEIATTYLADKQQFVVFSRDITVRKQAEQDLRVAAAAFDTHDAILITDVQGNIVRVNKAFTDITGYREDEVLGNNPRIMSSGRQDKSFYIEMWQQLLHTGSWAGEIYDKRKNGEIYPKWLTITAVKNEKQETTNYVAIFSDITARKLHEDEIRNLAFYDSLTRLPNRRLFVDRFRAALTISARRSDYGAVLFIDLDRFKLLNDTLGHDYGDLLLTQVASRIKSCVREMDTVARLGGDEFVVLTEGVSENMGEASRKIGLVAEKIRETLAQPYTLKQHEHHCSPSIGISLYRGNEKAVDELIQQADMAMYQVKATGRNAVRFFDPLMQASVTHRASLENDLHLALAQGQLQLHYQVQMDNHRPIGAEALLRWQHPTRGIILPKEFIAIAEEGTLILDIGHWVLDAGCRQLAKWSMNPPTSELTLALNISSKQFAQHNFVEQLSHLLKKHQINPARLKLELSESLVLNDLGNMVKKMHQIKKMGVKLSMDDFGTGYSSLSYLKDLPLDQIKIDQTFVQSITDGSRNAMLVQTVIDLAKNFSINVIAEGVETDAQLTFLQHHGCMAYQGHLFGKPLSIEEFDSLLAPDS